MRCLYFSWILYIILGKWDRLQILYPILYILWFFWGGSLLYIQKFYLRQLHVSTFTVIAYVSRALSPTRIIQTNFNKQIFLAYFSSSLVSGLTFNPLIYYNFIFIYCEVVLFMDRKTSDFSAIFILLSFTILIFCSW